MNQLLSIAAGLTLQATLWLSPTAHAQPNPMPTVALMCVTVCDNLFWDAFRQSLKALGREEGKNLRFVTQAAGGDTSKYPSGIRTLIQANPDVIVVSNNHAVFEAKAATTKIPIVVIAAHDVTGTGLVKSLRRPGGNITGQDTLAPTLDAKRVEMLKEMLPRARRLALLHNPTDQGFEAHFKSVELGAKAKGLTIERVEVRTAEDFDGAFAKLAKSRPDVVLTMGDSLTFAHQKRIAEALANLRIPGVYEFSFFVEAGGLISYGPSLKSLYASSARFVAKILDGTKPSDLPVEYPTLFELVVNRKTANTLGITIPYTIMVRAERVIE